MQARSAPPGDTRAKILRATLDLVGEHGVAQLTNRKVASAAGVSLGSLTYHFESQQTLLRETLELFLAEETARLGALATELEERRWTPAQGAEALQAFLAQDTVRRVAKVELYLQAARDEGLREAASNCFAAYDRLAEASLSALGVDDPAGAAPMVVAIIDGMQLRRLASGEAELRLAQPLQVLLRAFAE